MYIAKQPTNTTGLFEYSTSLVWLKQVYNINFTGSLNDAEKLANCKNGPALKQTNANSHQPYTIALQVNLNK